MPSWAPRSARTSPEPHENSPEPARELENPMNLPAHSPETGAGTDRSAKRADRIDEAAAKRAERYSRLVMLVRRRGCGCCD